MRTTCASDAKRRFLRSLPWLALSLSAAVRLTAWRGSARQALQDARARLGPLEARASAIAGLGPAEQALPDLPGTLVAAMDVLRAGDVRQGVSLEALTLPGRGSAGGDGPPDAVAISRLARPMPGVPGLRTLRLDVRASYRSYAGLQQWLAALGNLPLGLHRVWLDDRQVQLVIELVGR